MSEQPEVGFAAHRQNRQREWQLVSWILIRSTKIGYESINFTDSKIRLSSRSRLNSGNNDASS